MNTCESHKDYPIVCNNEYDIVEVKVVEKKNSKKKQNSE